MAEEQQVRPEQRRRHRHGGYMLIPAGVLLGLGIGLLAGYPGSGVLIGLGLGFIGAAIFPYAGRVPDEGEGTRPAARRGSGILAIVGAFMVIIGIGILWAPLKIWPSIAALFIILLGIWFLFRGFFPRR